MDRKKYHYPKKPLESKPRPTYDIELRTCLMCGEDFESLWIGNRRCKQCDSKGSVRASQAEEEYSAGGVL